MTVNNDYTGCTLSASTVNVDSGASLSGVTIDADTINVTGGFIDNNSTINGGDLNLSSGAEISGSTLNHMGAITADGSALVNVVMTGDSLTLTNSTVNIGEITMDDVNLNSVSSFYTVSGVVNNVLQNNRGAIWTSSLQIAHLCGSLTPVNYQRNSLSGGNTVFSKAALSHNNHSIGFASYQSSSGCNE